MTLISANELVTTSLSVGLALAWQGAITELITVTSPASNRLKAKFAYAIVVTILIIAIVRVHKKVSPHVAKFTDTVSNVLFGEKDLALAADVLA